YKRRQAGRVNINRAGRYRGSKRRLVGVTSQVQQRRMVRQSQGSEQSQQRIRQEQEQGAGTGNRAQENHTKAESAGLNVP
ncbi:unnamed protein product, partial [Staurois parvus]